MKTLIFLGPSLSIEKAKAILPDALYYPPIKCGDIIHAIHQKPDRIAIVDGYFENVAAVWHKEILLALDHHIEVYGAASMGALRAAELAPFGMIGVGKIFEDFRAFRLEDDDEVTVVHRPGRSAYAPVTDAMVNIRATLSKAQEKGVINTETGEKLIGIAKNLFYKNRYLSLVFDLFEKQYPTFNIKRLRDWVGEGHGIDQKAEDTMALLNLLKKNTPCQKINMAMRKTILLQKLMDQQNCEPVNNETEGDDNFWRYVRLCAYTLKTSERLELHDNDDNIQKTFLKNNEMKSFFYGLLVLFDESLLHELNLKEDIDTSPLITFINSKHEKAKYVKALLFCAFVIFEVSQVMKAKGIFLNQKQKVKYAEALKAFLPEAPMSVPGVEIDQLVTTYFILKDMINNSVDCFLAETPACVSVFYCEKAKNRLRHA